MMYLIMDERNDMAVLNLKPEQVFRVKNDIARFKFNDQGILLISQSDKWVPVENVKKDFYKKLMDGALVISERGAVRPKFGDTYYYVYWKHINDTGSKVKEYRILDTMWIGNMVDQAMFAIGNCFTNETDARSNVTKVMGHVEALMVGEEMAF